MDALLREVYRRHLWTEQISYPSAMTRDLGMSEAEADSAARDLMRRGLVDGKDSGGGVGITSYGIAALEAAILGASPPPPAGANEVRIRNAAGVQIQQGMGGGTQQMGSAAAMPPDNDSDAALVRRRQAERMAILTYLYEASDGDPDQLVRWPEAMRAAGIGDRDEFIGQMAYLSALGLADLYTMDSARILPGGVDRIEQAEQRPSESTEGLASMNVVVIETATNVQVQQGVSSGVQVQGYDAETLDSITAWLGAFEQRVDDLGLDDAELQAARTMLDAAKQHASAEHPRPTMLRSALHALREFAIAASAHAAGSVAAAELLSGWPHL